MFLPNLRKDKSIKNSRSKITLIFTVLFVVANIFALIIIYHKILPPYPIGWDAPYYITNVRYFEQLPTLVPRIGLITVLSFVQVMTRMSLVSLVVWMTPTLVVLLALGTAGLVYYAAGRRWLAFGVGFFFALWFTSYFALSISTFDNAFGLAMTLTILNLVLFLPKGWWRGILIFLGAAVIGTSHLESFGILSFILLIFWTLSALQERSLKKMIVHDMDIIVAWSGSALTTAALWWPLLHTIATGYIAKADPSGNASIPYASSHNITEVFSYFGTSISGPLAITFAALAVALLFYLFLRKPNSAHRMVLAYVACLYAVLMYAAIRKSIPINRAALLVPVPFLLSLGFYYLFAFFRRRLNWYVTVFALSSVVVILGLPIEYQNYLARFPKAVSSNYYSFQELGDYVRKNSVNSFVVVADINTNTAAASAYYGLWNNWISATAPLPTHNRSYCLYLGSINNLLKGLPSSRTGNIEYYSTSQVGLACSKTLPSAPRYFVLYGSYGDSLNTFLQGHKTIRLSEYVYEIQT